MRMVNKCVDPTSVFFLLSRWYAEDCERLRLLQPLKSLRGHPVDILVSSMDQRAWRLINSSAPRFIPKEIFSTTDHVWCRKRGSGRQAPSFPTIHSHHVPPFKTTNSTARVVDTVSLLVSCPRHKSLYQRSLHSKAFLSDTGSTGYAQKGFFAVCGSCNFRITREALAVAKFASDLSLDPNNPSDFFVFKCAVYLPYAPSPSLSCPTATNLPQRYSARPLRQALRQCCQRV